MGGAQGHVCIVSSSLVPHLQWCLPFTPRRGDGVITGAGGEGGRADGASFERRAHTCSLAMSRSIGVEATTEGKRGEPGQGHAREQGAAHLLPGCIH